jgi:hypothetical protein
MGVTPSGRGRIIDSAAILFILFIVLVLAGFAIWITIIVRRASRLTRASDIRLTADLQSAVAEVTGTAPMKVGVTTDGGAIMFADELPAAPEPITVPEFVEGPTLPEPNSVPEPVEGPSTTDIESRLDKLAGLHARGVITDDELATARLKILAE